MTPIASGPTTPRERHPELDRRHGELERRLALLGASPDLTDQQQELIEAWRAQLGEAVDQLEAPLTVAFLAQVGRGKSTLISVATGLHLDLTASPQDWSVLPVGDGRTTLGETRIDLEERADIALTVEPWPEDLLRQELKYFAEDLWHAARGTGGGGGVATEAAGVELHELLRAWLEPEILDRRGALRELARGFEDAEGLTNALLSRLDLAVRCAPFNATFSNDVAGLTQLQELLVKLMDGELSGAPAPRVTRLQIPALTAMSRLATVVDTQGLEPVGTGLLIEARVDLQRLFNDRNTLFVVCSEFEAAPDGVAIDVLKTLAGRGGDRVLRVLVVDRRAKTTDAKAVRQRLERLEQCRDKVRRAEIGPAIPDDHFVAIDARRESVELQSILQGMVDEAIGVRVAAWGKVLDGAELAIQPLGEKEHATRVRELDLRIWWAWDAAMAEPEAGPADPLTFLGGLIRQREPWIQHWSHVHAAIRRRGRYQRLDLVEVAATGLSSRRFARHHLALTAVSRALESGELGHRNDAERAHVVLRLDRMNRAVAEHRQQLHRAVGQVLGEYFASPNSTKLWTDCYLRWGQGPGYVADIAERFAEEGHRSGIRVDNAAAPAPERRFPARPPFLHLRSAGLTNFRCEEDASVNLTEISVLVGDNGLGKTAWLEAIAAGLGVLLPGMGAGEAPRLRERDVRQVIREIGGIPDRQVQLPMMITLVGEVQGRALQWSRSIEALPDEAEFDDDAVRHIARGIADDVRAHSHRQLPVLCYYGTQRLWPVDVAANTERGEVGTRFDGYFDCLSAASTHSRMVTWMWKFTLVEGQRKRPVVQLHAISQAVVRCVRGARSFRYDLATEELQLTMADGRVVPFSLLSDGYRNIVAMVADIAWRACVLNPQLFARAPELVEGVVLIDEIDLHLHPRWQRHVLADLRRAFPRLQFICTTHSPFIIQSLEPGQLVNLDPKARNVPYANRSPEDITEDVMGVDLPQRSQRYQQMLAVAKEYYELLDRIPAADESELAELRRRLDEVEAPFSQDMAFTGALRHERLAAEKGIR